MTEIGAKNNFDNNSKPNSGFNLSNGKNDTGFKLSDIELFLLDLDGTLYIGKDPIIGAFETVKTLRDMGKKVCFLTNNSSRSSSEYIKKLNGLGLSATTDEIVSSTKATMFYLKKYHTGKSIYLVATPSVKAEFIENGFTVLDSNADIAVLTFDTTLDYNKITSLCNHLKEGAFYVATHPDMVCPFSPHDLCDIGAFMLMIEGATGRKPDVICGKPYSPMAEYVTEIFSKKGSAVAMVGDRLYTDTRFGIDNGLSSVLVLTGETNLEMLVESGLSPTLVIDSFRDILLY